MQYVQSPYHQSRNGYKVEAIVVHTMVGYYESTIRYFQSNERQVSAHYCVSLSGDITQMVKLDRAAHHAGIVTNPTAKVVLAHPGANPNWYTIGIENADNTKPHDVDRSDQLPELAQLIADLCKQFNLPANRDTIIGHREVYAVKTCPGNINMDDLVKQVQAILSGQPAQPGGQTMTHQEFYNKFLEGFRKHKDDIEWGDDKHKFESEGLNDSAMLGRMFDNIAIFSKKKQEEVDSLNDDKKRLEDEVKALKLQISSGTPTVPSPVDPAVWDANGLTIEEATLNGKKITNYKRK